MAGEIEISPATHSFTLLDDHLAIFSEVVSTTLNSIGIRITDPQGLVALHLAATGIEEIVILADLCEALYPHQIIIVKIGRAYV